MIRKETVLILGAGASVPYGFPTGTRLIEAILAGTREQDSQIRRMMRLAGAKDSDVDWLREALAAMQFTSIDAFLEHRSQFRDVGKLAIAAALIPCERRDKLNPTEANVHWYKQLFNSLLSPFGFSGHKLTIITLNYDRSLEQYLFDTLQRDFELEPKDAAEKTRQVTFIHLHGRLGRLPWWQDDHDSNPPHEYAPDCTDEGLKAAAKSIRIVSEWNSSNEGEPRRYIQDKIRAAEAIGFLGFGYHESVMQRLEVSTLLAAKRSGAQVFASAYQLPNGRRLSLQSEFQAQNFCIGNQRHGTFEFLDDCGLLFQ